MKKSKIYLISIGLFILAASFIISRYSTQQKKKATTLYAILDRKGPSSETEEWKLTRNRAMDLYKAIVVNPDDTKSMLALAGMFVQEARITGNYTHYDMAAMKYINDVLKKDTANFEALSIKSLLYLSQHHFADGLAIAEKAKAINPYNSFVYGILVDGNVEMGYYDAAVENSDKMISIRPDIRSYSRISYLREIHGDNPGAIEAMKLAISAGVPGDENTEWCRVQLGKLYEHAGDTNNAAIQYNLSLQERPAYAYLRDRAGNQSEAVRGNRRRGLRLRDSDRGPLPRELLQPEIRLLRRVSPGSQHGAFLRGLREVRRAAARRAAQVPHDAQGPRARHRPHRLRQVHHARGDD